MIAPDEDAAWSEYRARFSAVYEDANYNHAVQSWVMRSSHRICERRFGSKSHFARVLEVGAGTGEHLRFVRHGFEEYVLTDLDPKTLEIARSKVEASLAAKVRFEVQAGDTLPYAAESFDRVIAAHVLEHINQPQRALREWQRVLKPGGMLSVLIPTDPGVAWRLGRHFGPRRRARAMGIPYDYIMAREHVNPCNNLVALLRYYMRPEAQDWWPTRIPSMDMNLFYAFHARKPLGG